MGWWIAGIFIVGGGLAVLFNYCASKVSKGENDEQA